MRKVTVNLVTPYDRDLLWGYFKDIGSYPKHITFVRRVEVPKDISKGSQWYDTTGILWVPMRLHHLNTHWEEKNKISFTVKMPVKGNMEHSYFLKQIGGKTHVTGEVHFEFKNRIVDAVIGPILEKRLEYMLLSSFKRIEKKLMIEYKK